MPSTKPTAFPVIPALDATTELYTQRRASAEAPANYRFSIDDIAQFLLSEYSLLMVYGEYDSDAAAQADSVPVGGAYTCSTANIYGLPAGTIKTRVS
jgi:hypothetical protein